MFAENNFSDIIKLFQIIYIYHTVTRYLLSLRIRIIYTYFSPFLLSPELFHTSSQKATFKTLFLSGQFKSDSSRSCAVPCKSQVPSSSYYFPAMFCLSGLQHFSRLNNQELAFSLQKYFQIY